MFYTIFYGVLAALVAICMWVFFQTLDPRIPKWKLDKSLIGTNPGLGFRPLPPEDNVESTLIWYKGTDYENYSQWTDALTKFLAGMVIFFFDNYKCSGCRKYKIDWVIGRRLGCRRHQFIHTHSSVRPFHS